MTQPQDSPKPIDLAAFERICERLKEALTAYAATPENLFILDSVVKRFELTYELATRSLRRYLLDYSASPAEIEALTFQETIRRADELGLIAHNWPEWKLYREARNETTHTYREEKARKIAEEAKVFLAEAEYLLENLKRRISTHG